MSFHRRDELIHNQISMVGIVEEVDGEKHRVRVRLPDQDDAVSPWFDVMGKGGTKNASFDMPDVGDAAIVTMDQSAERGFVMGTQFNDQDPSPVSNPNITRHNFRDGSVEEHNPDDKTRTVTMPDGTFKIQVGGASLTITPSEIVAEVDGVRHVISGGGEETTGGSVTHNGTNIGDTHRNTGVVPGGGLTGPPV